MPEKPIQVHPDLLKSLCPKHGLFEGNLCPTCEVIDKERR